MQTIALVESPYKEKFAIPRQPGLVNAARGKVVFQAPYDNPDLYRGIEQFSHLWLIFRFHQTESQGWQPLIRPPRLGGNSKIGVLASRSTFRPNPIGMSVVQLLGVNTAHHQCALDIAGLDLLDGTPILDIKPYVPYSDAQSQAEGGYAMEQPQPIAVTWQENALRDCQAASDIPELQQVIEQVLAQDPRPAYRKGKPDTKVYGVHLYHFNIQFDYPTLECVRILSLQSL